MNENIKKLKEEVKSLRDKVVEARGHTGRIGLKMIESQEALEKAKEQLAKCTCGAKLEE